MAVSRAPIMFGSGPAYDRRPETFGNVFEASSSLVWPLQVSSQMRCASQDSIIFVMTFTLSSWSVWLRSGTDVNADLRVHVAIWSNCPTLIVIAFVRVAVFRLSNQPRCCYGYREARGHYDEELRCCLASLNTSICVAPYRLGSFGLRRYGRCCRLLQVQGVVF
jgi:hypothetical protein